MWSGDGAHDAQQFIQAEAASRLGLIQVLGPQSDMDYQLVGKFWRRSLEDEAFRLLSAAPN
jgi:hypothetical protein